MILCELVSLLEYLNNLSSEIWIMVVHTFNFLQNQSIHFSDTIKMWDFKSSLALKQN